MGSRKDSSEQLPVKYGVELLDYENRTPEMSRQKSFNKNFRPNIRIEKVESENTQISYQDHNSFGDSDGFQVKYNLNQIKEHSTESVESSGCPVEAAEKRERVQKMKKKVQKMPA